MPLSAMYPGTFDPITLGHEDLVRRAARLFDQVVVAIARDTGGKVPMFTFGERVEMAKHALAEHDNVEIRGYSGLTVEYARKNGHQVIVRGLRAVSDFEYEFQLAGMNRQLMPEIETIFMTPTDKYQFISATLVREIALLGGDVSKFVSPLVAGRLDAKLRKLGRKP